ncbi:uncharacterized protein MONBRDRAFT_35464 [Monosiga brevicollis MX1]|uniref:Malonyl-CoA:ACP transacylase (MAT) domain-containing protein n=1 Tax=Monosiga brevicollis TaxID=81824 RepID=A9UP89_MONBE|nr:uncharacterized protein MONBRDRAFT_35464 [Monosiga brevicollis MX1]EDQ92378.1 predicted protein [Monosiga brevicollis MX1]|eukprot:XP_001742140.1 hypothetical protein [Monosiga brevicollis MX1]
MHRVLARAVAMGRGAERILSASTAANTGIAAHATSTTTNTMPTTDSNTPTGDDRFAFLFPGQGAQELAMTKNELELPAVAHLYERAKDILGYDLQAIVMGTDEDKLSQTEFCQPAMLIAGLAAVERLRDTDASAEARCVATAGLSLGEYTALVFAGALDLDDALRVVKVRAEGMQAAGQAQAGCMMTVIGLDDETLEAECALASEATQEVCTVANKLAPKIRAISGGPAAISHLEAKLEGIALKLVRLQVSGAFHSSLMAPASAALADVLETVPIRMPRIPVISNVTGQAYTDPEQIRACLIRQVAEPVLWDVSVQHALEAFQCTNIYELGPQRQIKAMVRKIAPKMFRTMVNVTI